MKITMYVVTQVEVTDEEYTSMRKEAEEPGEYDVSYKDIIAPEWLIDKAKTKGEVTNGYIPGSIWE